MATTKKRQRVLLVALAGTAVVFGATVGGRYLLYGRGRTTSTGVALPLASMRGPAAHGGTHLVPGTMAPAGGYGSSASLPADTSGGAGTSALPRVSLPPGPLVVETASVNLQVAKRGVDTALARIGNMARSFGGYVDSQSTSGGAAGKSPPPVPGTSPASGPRPANAGEVAWGYARHNSLAVLDALAVSLGWALPVLVLAALASPGVVWIRRRHLRGKAVAQPVA